MKAKLGKIVKTTKLNYIQLVGDIQCVNFVKFRGASVVQKVKRKMQVFEKQALAFCWVPGAGIEPARIAPLVFETSASTDSAIRACTSRREDRRIDVEGGRPSG